MAPPGPHCHLVSRHYSWTDGPEEPTKSPLQVSKERIRRMRSRYSISISVDPKSAKNLASPSPATPTPDTPTSIDSVRVPRRLVKPRPSHSSADPRAPSSSTPSSVSRSISTPISEKASSAKLWKLMKPKNLSHTSSFAHEPAPPVPALPKGFRSFFPVGSSPTSPISVSSDGGHSPRTSSIPNTSSDVQIHISQSRTVESHRSASLHVPIPIPSSSSSPAGNQKKMLHRLRATSSVEQGLIRSSTPSGQARPQIPSRPSTANATSSSPDPRFLNTSVIGRSRSMGSKRSSISSADEVNGHSPPPQNQLNHSPPPQQQSQTNKDIEPETRNNEKEGSLTGVSTGPTQSGSGNLNARRTVDKGYPPAHRSGFSRGRPSKVSLYLELPSRSATSPRPRININDLDNKSGSIRIPVPMPSPGRSASLGGFEWSMARSPENELPSLPVPPRKCVAERGSGECYVGGGGGVDVNGSENVLLLGRGRSSTTSAISPLSSPTSRVFS
ncbi:hypothetical protein F5887DRAFT_1206281 [Amanita rubescens]|nr:hypothetical protein F5887DRAFT_1206281 [Amanita rubescens]